MLSSRARTLWLASCAAAIAACSDLRHPAGPTLEQLVSIEVADSLTADGVTPTPVVVRFLGDEFRAWTAEVTLRTSGGALAPGATDPKEISLKATGGVARATLTSDTEARIVTVSAAADDITVDRRIRFVPAVPASVDLTASPLSVQANGASEINLTAELRRAVNEGTVTQGTQVTFFAEDLALCDASGADCEEVRFLRATGETDHEGKATATMKSTVPMMLRVIASSVDRFGVRVADTIPVAFDSISAP